MLNKNRHLKIAGVLLVLAGAAGVLTLDDAKYSVITLLGIVFLLLSTRKDKV